MPTLSPYSGRPCGCNVVTLEDFIRFDARMTTIFKDTLCEYFDSLNLGQNSSRSRRATALTAAGFASNPSMSDFKKCKTRMDVIDLELRFRKEKDDGETRLWNKLVSP
jgi:hypothetical protein